MKTFGAIAGAGLAAASLIFAGPVFAAGGGHSGGGHSPGPAHSQPVSSAAGASRVAEPSDPNTFMFDRRISASGRESP